MSTPSPAQFDWGTFSGRVRLFPIPGMVMFPHVLCPLHVFEPRYRRLTQAALAGDQLIAIPTLSDDAVTGEVPSDAKLDAVACLGRIASHHRLADGRYTLLLQGIGRVRLHEELTSSLPFREARAEGVADVYPGGDVDDLECRRLRDDVLARLGKSLSLQAGGI
ncbi:MAG: LON peptidase substrate-binding domain-containing protein [Pirellulales bacterium]